MERADRCDLWCADNDWVRSEEDQNLRSDDTRMTIEDHVSESTKSAENSSPTHEDSVCPSSTQSFALLLSLRISRFEEFDDTYTEVFGVQLGTTPRNDSGASDQLNRFASRVVAYMDWPVGWFSVFCNSAGRPGSRVQVGPPITICLTM